MKLRKKVGVLVLIVSLFFLLIGFDFNLTGNFIQDYFQGYFSVFHILGLILFIWGLFLLVGKESLEAIMVPTGPSYEADSQRAKGGVEKYNENHSRLVVISGKIDERNGKENFVGSQPMKIYKQMRKAGIPRDHFIFESESHNTQENVLYTLEKIKEKGLKDITIITDKPHAKRFEMLFEMAKKQGAAPKDLKIETYSKGIKDSYNPLKASLTYIKDYFSFGKMLEKKD